MEAVSFFAPAKGYPSCPRHPSSTRRLVPKRSTKHAVSRNSKNNSLKSKKLISRTSAVAEDSSITSDPAQVEITWQIVVGAVAGVTPFVVAGIEFGKRILQQRLCEVCKGSGLILRDDKSYIRCPACGGFLPWQSWRRFFTG